MDKREAKVDEIMETIPEPWRERWCGAEDGPCACMGCVQIGNRIIMFENAYGIKFKGDPEYINESGIRDDVYNEFKIDRDEWEDWKERHAESADT